MSSLRSIGRVTKVLAGVTLLHSFQAWAQGSGAPVAMRIASAPTELVIQDPPGWPPGFLALLAFLAFLTFAGVCVLLGFLRAVRNDRELQGQIDAIRNELRSRSSGDI